MKDQWCAKRADSTWAMTPFDWQSATQNVGLRFVTKEGVLFSLFLCRLGAVT